MACCGQKFISIGKFTGETNKKKIVPPTVSLFMQNKKLHKNKLPKKLAISLKG